MNWPNKISIAYPADASTKEAYWEFRERLGDMKTWCMDNLSSRGVLWEWECSVETGIADRWTFYFAQPQDAIMFRLVNGV